MTEQELSREKDFRACPILRSYIATMLQDLQLSELDEACEEEREPRNSGTIYTLPDSEYEKCKADCVQFYTENLDDISEAGDLVPGEDGLKYTQDRYMTEERVGSTFYLLRVGHGIAFTDDGNAPCLERLNEATRAFGGFDTYFGDDGNVYIA